MSNWLKNLMNLIFEDEEDVDGDKRSNIKTTSEKKGNKGKSVGRMSSKNRSIEPKVAHQYPKDGNFRFPLIPDKEDQKESFSKKAETKETEDVPQPVEEHKKSFPNERRERQRNGNRNRVQQQSERPKFTGENFKPRDIPSPIYGFGKRPEVFPPEYGPDHNVSNPIDKQEPAPPHEPGYEVLQAITDIENGNLPVEHVSSLPEEKEDTTYIQEWSFKQELELQEEHQTDEWSSDGKKEQKDPYYGMELEQDEVPELRLEKTDEIEHEEAPYNETIDHSNRTETYNEHTYNNTSDSNRSSDEIKESAKDEEDAIRPLNSKINKNNDRETKKSTIPFNVMMLQRDRNARSESTTKERSGERSPSRPVQHMDRDYVYPTTNLLDKEEHEINNDDRWLDDQIELLQSTLNNFNVKATVIGATKGPSVTRIEVQPAPGVKVNKITNLSDDIKLSLSAKDIRMEAPIPGRNAIGIEVPNKVSKAVTIREIITHPDFSESSSPLSVALGLDISGHPVITDLQKMPHGLIAGATGSGKSVCINSLLISILYKAHPDDVRLMLIDPKMVELAPYNQLPHLVTPVITDAKEATLGLKWAVDEMERRYELFAKTGVRDMERFNKLVKDKGEQDQKLPYIVVVIDELADLMMVSPQEVEDSICRIAQKARACGIHLLLATQRPSVDVITGLIKANVPTRVAFAVSSSVDSRTIIDSNGADKLLGKGDMLFLGNGVSKPVRIQGNFVSDDEIERITEHVKRQRDPDYLFEKEELVQNTVAFEQNDDLFDEACEFVLEQGAASSSSLQRRFRIGYNRAARLVDMMEARGIVSEAMGSKPRNVLVTKQEFYEETNQ